MNTPIQVTTTTETEEEAKSIAKSLTEQKLAGCVQIEGPIKSIYHWKGNIQEDSEWRLQIKSLEEYYDKIEDQIKQSHSYETPEIIATKIEYISNDYLDWLVSETI